jgi:hypothetical protein
MSEWDNFGKTQTAKELSVNDVNDAAKLSISVGEKASENKYRQSVESDISEKTCEDIVGKFEFRDGEVLQRKNRNTGNVIRNDTRSTSAGSSGFGTGFFNEADDQIMSNQERKGKTVASARSESSSCFENNYFQDVDEKLMEQGL